MNFTSRILHLCPGVMKVSPSFTSVLKYANPSDLYHHGYKFSYNGLLHRNYCNTTRVIGSKKFSSIPSHKDQKFKAINPKSVPSLFLKSLTPAATYATQTITSKKRTKRKAGTKVIMDEFGVRGYDHHHDEMTFPVVAYATCKELQLEKLRRCITEQGLYVPTEWDEELTLEDVIHATAKYSVGDEAREIFFFRDGAVVFWNVPDLERLNVLNFMRPFQEESYTDEEVMQESEYMLYTNAEDPETRLTQKGRILISPTEMPLKTTLEKFSFSNAMALSVKLGIWESTLETFADSLEHVTQELKTGKKLRLSRNDVLKKSGELFSLRHELNLNSDLLDTPDFYWERERLEVLYHKTFSYLSINRRTQVMNERLNQCFELLELILSILNDKHHVRLEWLIIWLITIEVGFEIWHVVEAWHPGT